MKIVLTSNSAVKTQACKDAFTVIAGSSPLEIINIAAVSGVNEQPFNDETVRGAKNRIASARETLTRERFYSQVENALIQAMQENQTGALYESIEQALLSARQEAPDADSWVSIENGIFEENGHYIDRAVVAVMNRDGQISISYSDGVEFPVDALEETRKRGFDKWTVGKIMQEMGLVKDHADPHADLPPYKPRAAYLAEALGKAIKNLNRMGRPKILFGVCGIGSGHTFRQLPMIDHFAKDAEIVIFGYGHSYDFYSKRFKNAPNVTVARVAVPFYAHTRDGIDFRGTAQNDRNQGQDFYAINAAAMLIAEQRLGKPDLVISDYEPVCAQYAYAKGTKLVTIDQQSKYLVGDFPGLLNGQGYQNEVQMLRMFFPRAEARLACSFFKTAKRSDSIEDVQIVPPVLNDAITSIKRTPDKDKLSILIYMSVQQPFPQSTAEIDAICASQPNIEFHIFSSDGATYASPNVHSYRHGDTRFHQVLGECNGIVSTAGHTLLSEAMYLGIPVYAIPLPVYEQQMNAQIIHENGFGISHPSFNRQTLETLINNIPHYADAIDADRNILLRVPGQWTIIDCLKNQLTRTL